MRSLRTTLTLVMVVLLIATGAALIAEAVGAIDDAWRIEAANSFENALDPGQPAWQATLLGLGVTAALLMFIVAEFSRPPRGTRIMHNVHSFQDGETRISGKAAMRAAAREVEAIEGVTAVDASLTKKTITITVRVDDRADLDAVESQARQRLGHEFWINLGLADLTTNIVISHDPKPPRVR